MSTFATRLHNELYQRRWKQRKLAERTGLCETAISHLVNGRREPNLHTLRAILDAMPDVDARTLIGSVPSTPNTRYPAPPSTED